MKELLGTLATTSEGKLTGLWFALAGAAFAAGTLTWPVAVVLAAGAVMVGAYGIGRGVAKHGGAGPRTRGPRAPKPAAAPPGA